MSDRKKITKALSAALEDYLKYGDTRVYIAREVTFDFGTDHAVRVDYMRFNPRNNTTSGIEKGDFYCYEIKSCMEDFKSAHGHNFIGDFNYYVMPLELAQEVVQKVAVPYYVGILAPVDGHMKIMQNAKRRDRNRPVSEMLLMMFRSANRDFLSCRTDA